MIEILKENNLKTDRELLNDDLDIILSENHYKEIVQNHQKIVCAIKSKKTMHQEKIKEIESKDIVNTGSEEINEVNNHVTDDIVETNIEANIGSELMK